MAASKDAGLSGSCRREICLFQSSCGGPVATENKVTSQMQEAAGETLQLTLEVFICTSFGTTEGLVGDTLQQFVASCPFLQ